MVNGRFRCCGSPQQLKSKFGEGYTLIAQTKIDDDTDEVIEDSTSTVSSTNMQKIMLCRLMYIIELNNPETSEKTQRLQQFAGAVGFQAG